MRSFLVVGMCLFDMLELGCMLKVLKLASMVEMDADDNGKLVAFGLSIWHYNFALDECDSQSGIMRVLKWIVMKRLGRGLDL